MDPNRPLFNLAPNPPGSTTPKAEPNPNSPFNFNPSAAKDVSKNLFGGATSSQQSDAQPAAKPFSFSSMLNDSPAASPAGGQQASAFGGGGEFGGGGGGGSGFGGGGNSGGLFGNAPKPQGQSSLFGGAQPSSTTTSLFGAGSGATKPATTTNLFGGAGATNTSSSSNLFGGAGTTTSSSGPSTMFGGAAASKPATTNIFGKPAETGAPASLGSLFGNPPAQSSGTTNLFGKPAEPASTTNLFGKPSEPASTTNLFGKPAETKPTASNFFGKPAETSTSNPFGKPATTATSTSNLFGTAPAATTTSTSNLFGAPAASTGTTSSTSNLFGAPPAKPASTLFGGPSTTSAPSAPSGGGGAGMFGAPPAAPSGTTAPSLFSSRPANPPPATLFSTKPATKPATANPFGHLAPSQSTAPSSLFDELGKESAGQPASKPSLFSAQPAPKFQAPAGGITQSLFSTTGKGYDATPQRPTQPQPTPRSGAFDNMSFFDSQSGKSIPPVQKEHYKEDDLVLPSEAPIGNRFGIGSGLNKDNQQPAATDTGGGFNFGRDSILGGPSSGMSSYADILRKDGMDFSAHTLMDQDLAGGDEEDSLRVSKYYYVEGGIDDESPTLSPRNSANKHPSEAVPLVIPNADDFLYANPENLIAAAHELISELHGAADGTFMDDGDSTPTRHGRKRPSEGGRKIDTRFLRAFKAAAVKSNNQHLADAYGILALMIPLNNAVDHASADGLIREIYIRWAVDGKFNKDFLEPVLATRPNPACAQKFWHAVFMLIAMGEPHELANLLSKCDFAQVVDEDGQQLYRKSEVNLIENALTQLIRLLRDVPNSSNIAKWRIWRGALISSQEEMRALANPPTLHEEQLDEADFYLRRQPLPTTRGLGFGGKRPQNRATQEEERRRRPRLPQDVADNLEKVYLMLEGDSEHVYPVAKSWELALVHKVYWDRYDEDNAAAARLGGHGTQRAGFNSFRSKHKLNLPTNPLDFLKKSYKTVTKEYPIDSTNPAELALSHAICGDWKAVVEVMVKEWNILSAAAFTVEYARVIGWAGAYDVVEIAPQPGRPTGTGVHSKNRLEALFAESFGGRDSILRAPQQLPTTQQQEGGGPDDLDPATIPWSDKILARYAIALMSLQDEIPSTTRAGSELSPWEISMSLLSRLHSQVWAQSLRRALIPQTPLNDPTTVDAILAFCAQYGLKAESRLLAKRFATTAPLPPLGQRLKYLSAAADYTTLHSLIQTLILLSLRQGRPYPSHDDLDPHLADLVSEPPSDPALRHLMSGYVVLREFLTWKCSREAGIRTPLEGDEGYGFEDEDIDEEEEMLPGAIRLLALIRGARERIQQNGTLSQKLVPVEPWILPALLRELIPFLFPSSTTASGRKRREDTIILETTQLLDILAAMEPWSHSTAAKSLGERVLHFLDRGKFPPSSSSTSSSSSASNSEEDDITMDFSTSGRPIVRENVTGKSAEELKGAEECFRRVVRVVEGGGLGGVEGRERGVAKVVGSVGGVERVVRVGIARGLGRGWVVGGV